VKPNGFFIAMIVFGCLIFNLVRPGEISTLPRINSSLGLIMIILGAIFFICHELKRGKEPNEPNPISDSFKRDSNSSADDQH